MFGSEYLFIPGPTPIPERITRAMQQPMINHRGPAFHKMMGEIIEGVKKVYKTEKGRIANVVLKEIGGLSKETKTMLGKTISALFKEGNQVIKNNINNNKAKKK